MPFLCHFNTEKSHPLHIRVFLGNVWLFFSFFFFFPNRTTVGARWWTLYFLSLKKNYFHFIFPFFLYFFLFSTRSSSLTGAESAASASASTSTSEWNPKPNKKNRENKKKTKTKEERHRRRRRHRSASRRRHQRRQGTSPSWFPAPSKKKPQHHRQPHQQQQQQQQQQRRRRRRRRRRGAALFFWEGMAVVVFFSEDFTQFRWHFPGFFFGEIRRRSSWFVFRLPTAEAISLMETKHLVAFYWSISPSMWADVINMTDFCFSFIFGNPNGIFFLDFTRFFLLTSGPFPGRRIYGTDDPTGRPFLFVFYWIRIRIGSFVAFFFFIGLGLFTTSIKTSNGCVAYKKTRPRSGKGAGPGWAVVMTSFIGCRPMRTPIWTVNSDVILRLLANESSERGSHSDVIKREPGQWERRPGRP